tara:strand:- start:334 stop:705 length:372 start_codon:yes stop_codon:yes gene_type:complete
MSIDYRTIFDSYDNSFNQYKNGYISSEIFDEKLIKTLNHLNNLNNKEKELYDDLSRNEIQLKDLRIEFENTKKKSHNKEANAFLTKIQKIDSMHSYEQIQYRFAIIGLISIGSVLVLYHMMKK